MNFYIKKNSTLPKLTVEVIVDSRTTFGNTNTFNHSINSVIFIIDEL